MSGRRPSPSITGTELLRRCNTLVLRLNRPSASTRRNEVTKIVEDAEKRVLDRFHQLLNKYVDFQDKRIRSDLAQALEEAENQEKFLEAFVLKLYHEANQIEERNATRLLNDDERGRLNKKTGYNKNNGDENVDNYHQDNHHGIDPRDPNYHHVPGRRDPNYHDAKDPRDPNYHNEPDSHDTKYN